MNKANNADKIYTFRLPATLLETLHEIAATQDLRVNQLIRRVLREFVDGYECVGGVEKEGK